MIIELILLFIALCCLMSPSLAWSIAFLVFAALTVTIKLYYRTKDLERVRKELGDLSGQTGHEITALKRQMQSLTEQMVALRATAAPHAEQPVPIEIKHAESVKPIVVPASSTQQPILHIDVPPMAHPEVAAKDQEQILLAPPPPAVADTQKPVAPPPAPPMPSQVPEIAARTGTVAQGPLSQKPGESPAEKQIPSAAHDQAKSAWPPPPPPPPPMQSAPQVAAMHETQGQASLRQPPSSVPLNRPSPPPAVPQAPPVPVGERLKRLFDLEEKLGVNWLPKIGIVFVVFGIALYGLYEFSNLGAVGKVALSYLAGAILLGGGIYGERNERYRGIGRVLIGGGWALLFFTAFAMQYVPAMRLLHTAVGDSILMFAVAVAMVTHTLRYRSQVVTGMAFLLAYGTISLSQSTVYSLIAGAILALGIVALVRRMRWFELEVFGILASYLAHLFWLYYSAGLGLHGAQGKMFPDFYPSTAILLFYWVIYRASYVWRKIEARAEEHVSSVAAVLNTVLLLCVMKYQSVHPDLAFYALLVLGLIEFALGQLPITRRRPIAFKLLTIIGTILMVGAVPIRYTGWNVALPWLLGGEALLLLGVFSRETIFRRLGMITGALVAMHMMFVELEPLITAHGWPIHDMASGMPKDVLLFLVTGIIFYANYALAAGLWREFFDDKFDIFLALVHSYAGYAALALGVWAYLNPTWTLVGWMALAAAFAFAGRKLSEGQASAQSSLLGMAGMAWAVLIVLQPVVDASKSSYLTVTSFCLAAGFAYLAAWLIWFNNDGIKAFTRFIATSTGTALLWILIAQKVDFVWQAGVLLLLAVALAEAGVWLKYRLLAVHVHALALWVVSAGIIVGYSGHDAWHGIQAHFFTPIFSAVLLYWLAKRAADAAQHAMPFLRGAYTWAAAIVVSLLLWHEVPHIWVAAAWMGYGIALTLAGRRFKISSLCYQEWAMAAVAAFRILASFDESTVYYGHISARLITVCLVAAGLYLVSRRSYVAPSASSSWSAYIHTWVATILLAGIACKEGPNEWLAAILAGFAVMLALSDRYFKTVELKWQCHGLAVAALTLVASYDVPRMQEVHGFTHPFIASLIVALSLYLLSPLLRFTDEQRRMSLHHVYTWVASTLASALIWYGVNSVGVAVGWAVFGVVLFWAGLHYKMKPLRLQGYVALVCAFARIFFVDLTTSPLTAAMVAVILHFVHIVLKNEAELETESRFKMSAVLSYLGAIAVAALCYFQLHREHAPVGWAAMVLVLFAAATFLRNSVYLLQGTLLTFGILFYGLFYSLQGIWTNINEPWTERAAPLGIAILILFCAMPFAYRLRQTGSDGPTGKLARMIRRPEQVLFFTAVLLVSAMILHWGSGFVTLGWGLEGVVLFLLALPLKERNFRLTGLILLLLCVLKIVFHDAWVLAPKNRYLTFIVLGAALTGVSFLYNRYREKFRELL